MPGNNDPTNVRNNNPNLNNVMKARYKLTIRKPRNNNRSRRNNRNRRNRRLNTPRGLAGENIATPMPLVVEPVMNVGREYYTYITPDSQYYMIGSYYGSYGTYMALQGLAPNAVVVVRFKVHQKAPTDVYVDVDEIEKYDPATRVSEPVAMAKPVELYSIHNDAVQKLKYFPTKEALKEYVDAQQPNAGRMLANQ
jgi:hypothetical protein